MNKHAYTSSYYWRFGQFSRHLFESQLRITRQKGLLLPQSLFVAPHNPDFEIRSVRNAV